MATLSVLLVNDNPNFLRMLDEFLVALSFMDPDEYREAALAAGADAFVSKARLDRDLIPEIQRLASRKPRRGTTPRER